MDIVSAVVAHLIACGIDAYGDVPNPRPERFCFVERIGGGIDERVLDAPTLAVQAWAQSWADAQALMDDATSALLDMPDGAGCTSMDVSTVARFPDQSGQPRMQAVVYATCYRG